MLEKLPKPLKNLSKLLSGNVITKIIGVAALIFYTRVLSKEELSIFPIYLMLAGLAPIILSFGFMTNLIKQVPSLLKSDIKSAKGLILTSALWVTTGTVLISICTFIFSEQIFGLVVKEEGDPGLLQIMTFGFVATCVSNLANQVLWAQQRFGTQSLLSIIESVFRPCCTIYLFYVYGLKGIVLGLVITQYFNAVLAVISIRSLLYGEFTYKHSITKLIKQSFPFYLESYLMYFRSQGDNWLVSTTLGATSLGLYYISKTIFSTLSVIYTSTDRVLTAQLANYKHEHQLFLENLNKIHLALSQFSVPFIFVCICFIPLAVQVLGGADYAQSITPAAILLLVLLVQLLRIPIGRTIFILKSSTNRLYITIVDTVSLLMLLFILTPLYGIVGVALARFISQTIGFVFAAWLFKKLMGFTLETKNILVSLLVCAPLLIFFIIEKTNSKMTEYLLGFGFTLFLWLTLITAILYFFNNKLFRKVKRATIDKLIFNK